MIVKTNLEMPTQTLPVTNAPTAQTSVHFPKAFSDSLLVASKAFSETGRANNDSSKVARRQSSHPEHAKAPSTVANGDAVLTHGLSHQTALPQRIPLMQRMPLINTIVIPVQMPVAESVELADASHDDSTEVVSQPARVASINSPRIESGVAQSIAVLSGAVQSVSIQSAISNNASNALCSTASNRVQNDANAMTNTVRSAIHNTPGTTFQNSIPNVVPNAISGVSPNTPLNADTAPVPRDALSPSASGDAASTPRMVASEQPAASASTPDQNGLATDLSAPIATPGQLVVQIQQSGGLPAASQDGVPGLNSTSAERPSLPSPINGTKVGKDFTSKTTGLKPQASSTSDPSATQPSSQGVSPSRDPSHEAESPPGQGTATTQINLANHAVASTAHALNAVIAPPVQTPTITDPAGHAAVKPENDSPTSVPLPQAPPIINTARLIQSMGQSEMRVGMRSNEFGNISISTSSTRDLISAQISLDHSELAKALAAHLPEFQERLGTHQAVDVRIDLNGQGPGSSSGMSNGSTEQSHGDTRQERNPASSRSGIGVAERQSSKAAASMTTGEGRLDTRLDIRV